MKFESIYNFAIIIFMVGILYFFMFKYKEDTDDLNKKENQKFISIFLFWIMPAFTFFLIYIYAGYGILNFLIFLSIQGLAFIITGNYKFSINFMIIVSYLFYVANEILVIIRGTPIIPVDLFNINLAISLTGNYSFTISSNILRATIVTYVLIYMTNKLINANVSRNTKNKYKLVNIGVIAFTIVVIGFVDINIFNISFFNVQATIKECGMPLAFCLNLRSLKLKEPEGYSKEYAIKTLKKYSSEEDTSGENDTPNIIVVMSESFTDIRKLYDLEIEEDPLEFFYSLKEDTIRGNVLVPSFGNGTSNTEFEFLTGMSNELFPNNSYPYMQYINKKTSSLVSDLKKIDYKTYAIHPYWEYAYRRNNVYKCLEFDDYISAEDFLEWDETKIHHTKDVGSLNAEKNIWGDLDTIRNYISDKENFNKIIEVYEKSKNKTFIFNITMQNHGNYEYDGEDFINDIKAKNIDSDELNQYLSLLKVSDDALREFIEYFKIRDERKTIILFFGDHYPYIPDTYEKMFGVNWQETVSNEDIIKMSIIPFFIWANYDIEEESIELIGMQYLSILLKEVAGIPLTSWDNFRKAIMEKYPAFNSYGTFDSSYEILDRAKLLDDELLKDYQILQYYLLKDEN